jgi:hypothetical protein
MHIFVFVFLCFSFLFLQSINRSSDVRSVQLSNVGIPISSFTPCASLSIRSLLEFLGVGDVNRWCSAGQSKIVLVGGAKAIHTA